MFKYLLNTSLVTAVATIAALSTTALPDRAVAQETQYFPIASSRVGPYSAMGTGYYGAQIDYINYVNMNGGVNGVMLTWQECETEYNAVKTVECYQRLLEKDGQKMVVFDTLGTPGAYAVINRMAEDEVVLAQYGYGRTDAADGRVWPWVFNAAGHYWSQIAVKMRFMAEQEGGVENMAGKKIVHMHIDSAFGREPLPAMRAIAEEWGVDLVEISIPPPGLEQQSQWLQVRREQPDWVTFWGAGSGMNSTGMTNAARVAFPRERLIYVTFGAAEEDMYPAGDSATGTYAMANVLPGMEFPLVASIKEQVYGAGEGNLADESRVGSVYWNRGLGAAVMWIEALKNAQEMHDKVGQAVTGAEFRAGYEALDMSEARLEEIGIKGMIAPFALSCENHEGADGRFAMMQWDGTKFVQVTDWEAPLDPAYIRGLVEESAAKFAADNGLTPRECS
ncbi:ABC transporter substrate-binding protein [Roseovarius sp. LXJ103]|uniref:ABC transporter substrate-binding protein n=1 Tax=Roseovarius carneus TaxID=2853164 RepID=UPI000D609F45|nr:ABC transporter substrate-binding protein [Roseovarius carneus]MBZ8117597.1 ABC transporter substrate-binding protein [Roseovarius carneus]PWE36613.1 ABC transporter permease [Pelagicola sp. LXJ1103]